MSNSGKIAANCRGLTNSERPLWRSSDDETINSRLKRKKHDFKGLLLIPREEQTQLYLKVLEHNAIIYLGTGLGKTFITVLFLNKCPYIDEQIRAGKKVVFMAPSQDLIKQQAEYVNQQVRYRSKIFCGKSANCGDYKKHWNKQSWKSELEDVDLLFMIPQIFSTAICKNDLSWDSFAAIIFDEAHHAKKGKKKKNGGHPYYQISKSYHAFYKNRHDEVRWPRPRIIGLTASLINSMPKNRDSIRKEITDLERILDARCVTSVEARDKRPTLIMHTYSSNHTVLDSCDILTWIFRDFITSMRQALDLKRANTISQRLETKKTPVSKNEKDFVQFTKQLRVSASGFSIKPESFWSLCRGLLEIRSNCGVWMLRAMIHKLILAVKKYRENPYISGPMAGIYGVFTELLEKVNATLDIHLGSEINQGLLSCIRPKPETLLRRLKMEYERTNDGSNGKSSFSCIIFVTSRLEVVALATWLQTVSSKVEQYNFIKCDYAIGLAGAGNSNFACITKRNANEQYEALKKFREGHINTIVTTSVLEEGIDLPNCSTVIRFNSPNNFRQYIQARGRARQDVSSYVTLCDEGTMSNEIDKLNKFADFELTLKGQFNGEDVTTIARQPQPITEDKEDYFGNEDNSIHIDPSLARTILHMYCNRLAQRTPFIESMRYDREEPIPGCHQTTLYLSAGCPIQEGIKGEIKNESELADDSAVVTALGALYNIGELDGHLSSDTATEANINILLAAKNLAPRYDDLDGSVGGKCIKEGGEEVFIFEPAIRRNCYFLSRDYEKRLYKLVKIQFVSVGCNNRMETEAFFQKSVLGFIIDASSSNEFIPPLIYSHYGQFQVDHEEISNNFLIEKALEHEEYLNYTHKILTDCLDFQGLKKDEFRNHCMFYIIPLDAQNNPDFTKIRKSFRTGNEELREGDIVKESHEYQKISGRRDNNLMLVKGIHHDMNARSVIPGTDNLTFLTATEKRFGPGIVADLNQSIIEVMQISKSFGSTKDELKSKRNDSTASRYYLSQFLENLNADVSTVFQSFLLPPLIYKLYIALTASSLDRRFRYDTRDLRLADNALTDSNESQMEMDILKRMENDLYNEDEPYVEGESKNISGADTIGTAGIESKDDDSEINYDSTSGVEVLMSDDTINDDESIMDSIGKYKDAGRDADLDSDDQDEASWDMSVYKCPEMKQLMYERHHSRSHLEPPTNTIEFIALFDEFNQLKHRLLANIDTLFVQTTNHSTTVDEELEFKRRSAKVDHSIVAPIHFDRNPQPMRSASRESGIIEALTQNCAQEKYNLECLENVGDSYLKYATSVVLYKSLDGTEGLLSAARSQLTCNRYFCHLARKRDIGSYAITRSFSKEVLLYIFGKSYASREDEKKLHNKMKSKSLADTFESYIGSYLVYQGEYEAILACRWLGLNIFQSTIFEELHPTAVVFSKAPSALFKDTTPELEAFHQTCARKINRFEDIIGYRFNDKSHLIQAFTHASSILRCTKSYERLEFLGDAVLDFLVTATLVKTTRMNDPGQLTLSRSALVNNVAFAKLAIKYKYDLFIQHCNHDIYDELTKVRSAMREDPKMNFLDMTNFYQIVKLLGDSFESVAGAIYLDSGNSLDTVWSIYYPIMKDAIDEEINSPSKNLLSVLHETFPGSGRINFKFNEERTDTGFIVSVTCRISCYDNSHPYRDFEGKGTNKNQAKRRAASLAMENPPAGQLKLDLDKKYLNGNNQPKTCGGSRVSKSKCGESRNFH